MLFLFLHSIASFEKAGPEWAVIYIDALLFLLYLNEVVLIFVEKLVVLLFEAVELLLSGALRHIIGLVYNKSV